MGDVDRVALTIPGSGWAKASAGRGRLLRRDELPVWYGHNPHILASYRPPNLGLCRCLATACEVHNETVNVWSHLAGAGIWLAFAARALASEDLALRADDFTYRIQAVCYGLCTVMFLASGLAHLMYCRGPVTYFYAWACDKAGILLLWFARAISEGMLALYCRRDLWVTWCMVTCFVFAWAGSIAIRQDHAAPLLGLYGFIHLPFAWLSWLGPAVEAPPDLWRGVLWSWVGSSCGVIGYVIMKQQWPERWRPGGFDLWFHSHQWWHLLTTIGPVICLEAGRVVLKSRLDTGCPAA